MDRDNNPAMTVKDSLNQIIGSCEANCHEVAKRAREAEDLQDDEAMLFYLTLKASQMATCMTVFKEQLYLIMNRMERIEPKAAQKMRGEFPEVGGFGHTLHFQLFTPYLVQHLTMSDPIKSD
ncbi:MAG TPA: hypothetical protein VF681_03695 [Abditibacteriaceae bacterium]|jgi:hypothetical protein